MGFLLIWKNKGFFAILYLVLFFILVITISKFLKEQIGGVFATNYNEMWLHGISFLLSGIATIFTDKYTIEKRKFVEDKYQSNELFFIPMNLLGKIFIGIGILSILGGLLEG